jgi:hypothetical protein
MTNTEFLFLSLILPGFERISSKMFVQKNKGLWFLACISCGKRIVASTFCALLVARDIVLDKSKGCKF